jgi:acyl-CoA hydrolase
VELTLYHRLVLPTDSNHHGTLYAGSLLRLTLEAGYATAWRHIGTEANFVLRRVLNLECVRPVPVGTVITIEGAVLYRKQAYLVTGLLGKPLATGQDPWLEALLGFARWTRPVGRTRCPPPLLPPLCRIPTTGAAWNNACRNSSIFADRPQVSCLARTKTTRVSLSPERQGRHVYLSLASARHDSDQHGNRLSPHLLVRGRRRRNGHERPGSSG